MPSPSFTLDAQLRFHDKWLKIDLQVQYSVKGENYCPFKLRGQHTILWDQYHVAWGTVKISKSLTVLVFS